MHYKNAQSKYEHKLHVIMKYVEGRQNYIEKLIKNVANSQLKIKYLKRNYPTRGW